MFLQRIAPRWAAAALLCALLSVPASAAGSDCAQRLRAADFGEDLTGICLTAVPETLTLRLGSRTVRSGDVLAAAQLEELCLLPGEPQQDQSVRLRYLPVSRDGVGPEAELVFSIRGRRNEAPTAGDSKMETYKNLPNEGLLDAADPEGEALSYTLTRAPRRGEVILRDDGSFLYTPKKNKVGTDSFTYTVTDPAGNVSREATVTIRILKPTDDRQYTDTLGANCRFEAEWLRNTGIFTGETVNGQFCFSPQEHVSRGQFLAMLMRVLELPVDRSVTETGFVDECPQWLRPYLAAALRSGIITGYPAKDGAEFRAAQPIRSGEAAVMARNALAFAVPAAALDEPEEISGNAEPLTRADAARALYQVSRLRRSSFFGLFG